MAITTEIVPIVSGYQTSKINSNFEAIAEALDDSLSRSGTSPNTMEADLDLNGHSLLNVDALSVDSLIVDGIEILTDEVLAKGDPGEAATVTVGVVSTGAAGSSVIVTNVGTELDAILDFTIPRGNTGASGAGSGDMVAAQNLNDVADKPTAFATIKQAATESATGVVELATTVEATAGVDTTRVVTPAGLAAALAAGGAGYKFSRRRAFSSNTNYTPTAGTDLIHVVMCGGGGGGGGADSSTSTESAASAAGGGSGAETIDFWLNYPADFSAPIALVVGNGGNGGNSSGTDGANGTDSEFGSIGVAKRGLGGGGVAAGGLLFIAETGAARSSNGTLPSGGLRFHGQDGGNATRGDGGTGSQLIQVTSGDGGNSYLGGAGRGATTNAATSIAGRDGGNYGSGGGGAVAKSTTGAPGGDGANGIIIIEEYVS